MQITCIGKDTHYVAMRKSSNLAIVPISKAHCNVSLLQFLRKQFIGYMKPVHRLDYSTAGCCLFVKTKDGLKFFNDIFKKRLIIKTYIAIVEGNVIERYYRIKYKLKKRDREDLRFAKILQRFDLNGVEAVTEVTVIKNFNGFSLVKCRLFTGRMHQIRIHLALIGHPIVGDRLYGSRIFIHNNFLCLHANSLIFFDLDGKLKYVYSDLEDAFKYWLKIFNLDFYL